VPPLHSLVAFLLSGVDTPALLYNSPEALSRHELNAHEAQKVDTAAMVIWGGPSYEKALAGKRLLDPLAGLKGLTLSSVTPLLSFPDPEKVDRSLNVRDMRFWLDPRLAKIAVGRIAPQLVRLYPDSYERIMENEIVLKQRLMETEHHMQHALGNDRSVPLHVPQSDVLYLAWRFNLTVPHCAAAARHAEGFGQSNGPELYFTMMKQVENDLLTCQNQIASKD